MQPTLVAGDSLDFLTKVIGYPATDGWTLTFRLVPRENGPPTVVTFNAVAEGEDYRVTLSPTTTALWADGDYSWLSWVAKTGYRYTVDWGEVRITNNPETAGAGSDIRTQAQKAADDCLAAMADIAATTAAVGAGAHLVKRYVIGNREIEYEGTRDQIAAQLSGLLAFWQGKLNAENAAKNVQLGLADRRRIYLRAGRA